MKVTLGDHNLCFFGVFREGFSGVPSINGVVNMYRDI